MPVWGVQGLGLRVGLGFRVRNAAGGGDGWGMSGCRGRTSNCSMMMMMRMMMSPDGSAHGLCTNTAES